MGGRKSRTLKLVLAYDGTRYAGWQRQRRPGGKPTIQATLEEVLRRILQEPVRVIGSGRTDAGVHAIQQVAHLSTRSRVPTTRLRRSLNQLLPPDLSVMRLDDVDGAFHARFGAQRKRYRYRLYTGVVPSPFIRPYVHHLQTPLNVARLRREAASLRGRHDFRAFARTPGTDRNTVRTIQKVLVRRTEEELQIELEGNGFLHAMVRSVVGTLIDVGRGQKAPGTIRRMLKTGDRRLAGTTAPPQGLALVSVDYAGGHNARR